MGLNESFGQLVTDLFASRASKLDLSEFALESLELWDGPRGLAREFKRLYDSCEAETAKVNLFKAWMELVAKASAGEPTQNAEDQLSMEELAGVLQHLATSTHGRTEPPAA